MRRALNVVEQRWRQGVALIAAAIVAIETILILLTSTVTFSSTQFAIDLWFTIDSMWRATSGQVPNVDFHGAIGPLFYGIYALTGTVTPFSVVMMLRADLLVGLLGAALTVAILWRRAPVEAIALLALIAFGAAVTGHEMGSGQFDRFYSFLAPYNRWGWALVVPAAAGALIPGRRTAPSVIFVGLIGAALLFLKMSYFFAFVLICLGGYGLDWFEGRGRPIAILSVLIPLLCAGVFLIVAPAMVEGYVSDLGQAASINSLRVNKLALSVPEAGIFAAASVLVLYLAGGWTSRRDWPGLARVLVAVGGGAMILAQNHDRSEAPMYSAALAIAYAVGRCHSRRRGPATDGRGPDIAASARAGGEAVVAYSAATILAAPVLFASLFSPVFQYLAIDSGEIHAFEAFDGTPLAALRLKDLALRNSKPDGVTVIRNAELPTLSCAWLSCLVMRRTASGVVSLRQLGLPSATRILTLDFSNPYPAIFRTADPRFGYSWYDYGRSWTAAFGPSPARLFSEADVVMEPLFNGPNDPVAAPYTAALPQTYRLAETTPYWRIWVKPSVLAARS